MSEDQVRRALAAVDDLPPPRDDLFGDRALQRGRARAGRRRARVLGAVATVALVATLGAGWVVSRGVLGAGPSTTALAPAVEGGTGAPEPNAAPPAPPASGDAVPGQVPTGQSPPGRSASPGSPGGMPPQLDLSPWLSGPSSPQRQAFDALAPTLVAAYGQVFGGAYATDPGNTHLVVTLTRRDPALEALVRSSMPSPSDVDFRVVANSAARKEQVAARVRADEPSWSLRGVTIAGVTVDARIDRVVVAVAEPGAAALVEGRYGAAVVRAVVVPDASEPDTPVTPKLPNGSPPPPLQR